MKRGYTATCFAFALALSLWALVAEAHSFRYQYVPLDEAVPTGFLSFDPATIDDQGRIFGTAYAQPCDPNCRPSAAVYESGTITILHAQATDRATDGMGTSGGGVVTGIDANNSLLLQAAFFRGSNVQRIPRRPGEVSSVILKMTHAGVPLVISIDSQGIASYYIYNNGRVIPVDFGPDAGVRFAVDMNNGRIISASIYSISANAYRGVRINPRTGEVAELDPLQTEPDSWALDINNRGQVLGYSFVFSGTERIGIWGQGDRFHTYFVEGTSQHPQISNRLIFNDDDLIVVSVMSTIPRTSYLVPAPGVRLDLADLTQNLPSTGDPLWLSREVNNSGDIIGRGLDGHSFLLKRIRS